MRKLKGIMINGEWLGEKVVINGVFHAICNISPIIMLEFTRLINNLDDVKEAFSITSFEFFNNDGIKVFFSNSEIKGQAHLSFELKNDKISLKTSTLEIYSNQENIDNKVSLTESCSSKH